MLAMKAKMTPVSIPCCRYTFSPNQVGTMLLAATLALGLLMQASSIRAQPATGQQDSSDGTIGVMAVVNGESISRQELAQECLRQHGEEVLESIVNRQLIANESSRRGVQVSREDVYREISEICGRFNIPVEQWIETLANERKIPVEKYEQMIWTTLSLKRLAADEIEVNPEEVQRQLESEIGPQVRVRVITVLDRDKAEKVHAMALNDPDSFGNLAKDYSDDKNSAATRGLIPPIRRHIGDPNIEVAAFAMQEGQISDIIEVPGQYAILKCESKIPEKVITPQFRAVAEERIVNYLTEKKLATAGTELFQRLQQEISVVNVYNDPEASAQMPGIAATVGETRITMRELAEECITRYGAEQLDNEINRKILMQHLKANQLIVEEAELQAEIVRAAETYGYVNSDGEVDIDSWLQANTQGSTGVESYVRDVVWPTVALKKLVTTDVEVTQDDLEKGFVANFGPRVEALAIVLQDERQAHKVWKMASDNGTVEFFGELAHEYSVEPVSKANYGRVPPIQRHGGRPRLEEEAFNLQPGELSGLIEVGTNWIILRCIGQTTPVVEEFDVVKNELYADIFEKKLRLAMAKKLDFIHSSAQIDNFLRGTTQSGKVSDQGDSRTEVGQSLPYGSQSK